MNESILNLIFKDVIAAYRNNPDCTVNLSFSIAGFDRLLCITNVNELDPDKKEFLGIPYYLRNDQKELYRVDVL